MAPTGRARGGKDKDSETDASSSDGRTADCAQSLKKIFTPNRKPSSNMSILKTPKSKCSTTGVFSTASYIPKRPPTAGNGGSNVEQDPIQVFCRVKPYNGEGGCILMPGGKDDNKQLTLIPPDNPQYWRQNTSKEIHYTFSKIYDDRVEQKTIFDDVALPLVKDFLEGKNALLFAYGVTGSGKTYTMCGTAEECGIMPRCLDVIFNSIEGYKASKYVFKPDRLNGFESQSKAEAMRERQKEILEKARATPRAGRANKNGEGENFANRIREEGVAEVAELNSVYSVFITHIEIYNNNVYDLLDESPIDFGRKGAALQPRMLRTASNDNVFVHGVTEVEVETTTEAFEVFQRGQRRRRIAHTALNTESSRSHAIFSIRLVRAPTDIDGEEVVDDKSQITVSQLSLVDLAGSERYSRTGATGDRLKEAGNINTSLMLLRQCMDTLRDNQLHGKNEVVPFRTSKLTHFLKNYFEGEGRVRMILCVNPRPEDYDENTHVLSFAEQTQEVQITRPQEKKMPVAAHSLMPPPPPTPRSKTTSELRKESLRQFIEAGPSSSSDSQFVFSQLPLPHTILSKSSDVAALATLKKALEMRVETQEIERKLIWEEQDRFRQMLIDMERENECLKSENTSMKSSVHSLTEEKAKNELVLREMMAEKQELEAQCESKDKLLSELEEENANLRMQYRQRDVQHFKEKQLLKSDLDIQRELDDLKRTRQLKKEEEKLKAKFEHKEQTLAAVRQLVSSVDVSENRNRRSSRRRAVDNDSMSTTSSEPDIVTASKILGDGGRPKSGSRIRAPSAPLLPLDNGQSTPEFGRAPANQYRHGGLTSSSNRRPRARSTDHDIWIEHTSGIAVEEGTVFKPYMKKRKSITKLTTAEDIQHQKASKYCLRTQELDADGDIETKLYKGTVATSVAGGTSVTFDDVEILRQESPTTALSPRKRHSSSSGLLGTLGGIVSSSPFRSASNTTAYEETAARCKQGIGSVIPKRSRKN